MHCTNQQGLNASKIVDPMIICPYDVMFKPSIVLLFGINFLQRVKIYQPMKAENWHGLIIIYLHHFHMLKLKFIKATTTKKLFIIFICSNWLNVFKSNNNNKIIQYLHCCFSKLLLPKYQSNYKECFMLSWLPHVYHIKGEINSYSKKHQICTSLRLCLLSIFNLGFDIYEVFSILQVVKWGSMSPRKPIIGSGDSWPGSTYVVYILLLRLETNDYCFVLYHTPWKIYILVKISIMPH